MRSRRLLEEDVRVLLVQLSVHTELEEPERATEDHVVAVPSEARNHLRNLSAREDVLLVGRLDLRAKRLLDGEPTPVVRLRPPAVVMWSR